MADNDKWSQYQVETTPPVDDKWSQYQVDTPTSTTPVVPTTQTTPTVANPQAPLTSGDEEDRMSFGQMYSDRQIMEQAKKPKANPLEGTLTDLFTPIDEEQAPADENMSLSRAYHRQAVRSEANRQAKETIAKVQSPLIPDEEKKVLAQELKDLADFKETTKFTENANKVRGLENSYGAYALYMGQDQQKAKDEFRDTYSHQLAWANQVFSKEEPGAKPADLIQAELNLYLKNINRVSDPDSETSLTDPAHLSKKSDDQILEDAAYVGIRQNGIIDDAEATKVAYDRKELLVPNMKGGSEVRNPTLSDIEKLSLKRQGVYQMLQNYGDLLKQSSEDYNTTMEELNKMILDYNQNPTQEGKAALDQYKTDNLNPIQEALDLRTKDFYRLLDLAKTKFKLLEQKERKDAAIMNDFDPDSWSDNLLAGYKTFANKNTNMVFGLQDAAHNLTSPFKSREEFQADRIAEFSKQKESQFIIPPAYESTPLLNEAGEVNWANIVTKNLETTAFSLEIAAATAATGGLAFEAGLGGSLTAVMLETITPVTMAMTYGDYYYNNLEMGMKPNQASALAGFQSMVEGLTERLSPLEAQIFNPNYWAKSGYRQMGKEEAIRTLFKQVTGKEIKQGALDYMLRFGLAGLEVPYVIMQETAEELAGDFGNDIINKGFAAGLQGYTYQAVTPSTLAQTAISTASTMALSGLWGGGMKLLQRQLPSYQLDMATNPSLYLTSLEEAYKNNALPELPFKDGPVVSQGLLYAMSKEEINRLSGLYETHKKVIDNLETKGAQAEYLDLVRKQHDALQNIAKFAGIPGSDISDRVIKHQDYLAKIQKRLDVLNNEALENLSMSRTERNKHIAGRMMADVEAKFTQEYVDSVKNTYVLNYFKSNLEERKLYANDPEFTRTADEALKKINTRLETLAATTQDADKLFAEGEVNNTNKTVTVTTKTGDKTLKYGVDYYVGETTSMDEEGHKIINYPVVNVIKDNGNGWLTVASDGEVVEIPKDSFKALGIGEKSSLDGLPDSDIRKIWFRNRNNVVAYKFPGALTDPKKVQKGRLQYDSDTKQLFFVYKKNGKVERIQVNSDNFVTQAGYTEPKIAFVKNLGETDEEYAKRNAELGGADFSKINNQKVRRTQAIQDFINKISAPIKAIEKKLAPKQKKLEKVNKKLGEINELLEAKKTTLTIEDLKPFLSTEEIAELEALGKKKTTPLRLVPFLASQVRELVELKAQIQAEIDGLEEEKAATAERVDVEVKNFQEILDEAEFKTDESMIKSLKDYRKELKKVIKAYDDSVQANLTLIDSINELIDVITESIRKIVDSFVRRFPSLPGIPSREGLQEYFDSLKQYLPNSALDYMDKVILEYENSIQRELDRLDNEYYLTAVETDLENAQIEREKLENAREEMNNYAAKIKLLDKAIKFMKAKEGEYKAAKAKTQIQEVKDIINSYFLKYQSGNQAGDPTMDAQAMPSESNKKSLPNLFQSTTSPRIYDKDGNLIANVVAENNAAPVRLQEFLNNVKSLDNISLLPLTIHNAKRHGLEKVIFTGGDTTNTGTDESKYDIRAVIVREIGDDISFLDKEGNVIPADKVSADNVLYTAIPLPDLEWKSGPEAGQKNYNPGDLTPSQEATLAGQLVALHKEFRQNLLAATIDGDAAPLKITGISRGILRKEDDRTTRNPIVGTVLPEGTDLSSGQLITIPTVKEAGAKTGSVTSEMRKDSVSIPVGRPMLNTGQHLVFLNNRKFTNAEVDKLVRAIVYLYDQAKANKGKLDPRVIEYLHKVLYWRNPAYESKATKEEQKPQDIGVSQIWYDSEKNAIMLGKMNDGIPFSFEGDDAMNVEALRLFFGGLYHNVNNTDIVGKAFEEIIDVDLAKGEIKTRVWPTYQEYLLSDKMEDGKTPREPALIPLTTNLTKSEEGSPNVSSRYINYENPQVSDAIGAAGIVVTKQPSGEVTTQTIHVSNEDVVDQSPLATGRSLWVTVSSEPNFENKIFAYYNKAKDNTIFFRVDKAKKVRLASIGDIPSHDTDLSDEDVVKVLTKIMISKDPLAKGVVEISALALKKGAKETLIEPKPAETKPAESTADTNPSVATETSTAPEDMPASSLFGTTPVETPESTEKDGEDIAYRTANRQFYKLENLAQAKAWFESKFTGIDFSIARGLIDGRAWGKLSKRAVILSDIAEEGTVYHEAFEAVYKYILTTPQILALRKEFRNRKGTFTDYETGKKVKYSDATNRQLKEQMAEEYREFELNDGVFTFPVQETQKSFFRKIWDAIHGFFLRLLGDPQTMEEVFKNISNAAYKDKVPSLNLIGLLNTGFDYKLARINLEDGGFMIDTMRSITSLLFQDMYAHKLGISDFFNGSVDVNQQYRNVKGRLDKFYGGQETLDIMKDTTVAQFITRFTKSENFQELQKNIPLILGATKVMNDKGKEVRRQSRLEAAVGNATAGEALTALYDVLKAYEYIHNNWDQLIEHNKEYLNTYKIDFQEGDTVVEKDESGNMNEYVQETMIYSAKENANAEVKLLIANLVKRQFVKYEGKKEAVAEPKLNSLLLSELVDYGKTMNSLLHKLADTTSFEEMAEVIKESLPVAPEYLDLVDKLKIGKVLGPNDAAIVDLRNKFYQTMAKMSVDYDKLIINEDGSSNLLDLNDEKGASLIRLRWLENLKSKQHDGSGLIYLNDSNQLTLDPKKLSKAKLKDVQDYKGFLEEIGFTFPINLAKMSQKDLNVFKDTVAKIFNILKKEDTEFVVVDSSVLKTPLTALAALYIKYTNSYAEPQHFNIEREPVQNILLNNYIGLTVKAFNRATSLKDLAKRIPQLDMTTANNPEGINGWHTGSQVIGEGTSFFSGTGEKRDKQLLVKILEGSEISGEGEGKHTSKLNFADRLAQEFAYNLAGRYYLLTPADTKTEWAIQFGHFVPKNLIHNTDYILNIMRNYLRAEILAVQQFKNSKKAGTPYSRIQRLNEVDKATGNQIGAQLRLFQSILDFPLDIPADKSADDIISENMDQINRSISQWIEKKVEKTSKLFQSEGVIREIKPQGELKTSGRYQIAFLSSDIPNDMSLAEAKDLVRFAEINYIMSMIEQHKLFWGDPAMWKDITKRVKSFVSGRMVSVTNNQYFNEWHNTYSNSIPYINKDGEISRVNLRPGDAGYVRYDGKIRTATSAEVSVRSSAFQSIKEYLLNSKAQDIHHKDFDELSPDEQKAIEKITEPEYAPYGKMDESDGQGWAFLPGYKEILERSNLWPPQAETQYQYEMAYERLARNSYAETTQGEHLRDHDNWLVHIKGDPKSFNFFVLKPIYAGLKDGPAFLPHLDKFSLAPVFYRAIEKSQFKDLYLEHVSNGTTYMKLESGNKVGIMVDENGKVPSFYNSEGGVSLDYVGDLLTFDHFGIQVETKTQKEHTTRGSQLTKLGVLNLLDMGIPIDHITALEKGGLPKEYADRGYSMEEYAAELWEGLTEEEKEEDSPVYRLVKRNNTLLSAMTVQARHDLFREFGIQTSLTRDSKTGQPKYQYTFSDLKKVEEMLQSEFRSRNAPENIKEFVKLIPKEVHNPDGTTSIKEVFALPFDMLIGGDKVENIINSVVDKRIVRPKLFGGAKPQISSTLMEKNKRNYIIKDESGKWVPVPDITELSEDERKKAVLTSNELKTYRFSQDGEEVLGCEIMIPNPFGKGVKFEDIPQDMLEGIGFRIPTQAVNSVEHFTIVGFLPDAYGDSIIVPSEIVAKAGTDFDIDKLNLYLYNYQRKGKGIQKVPYLDNSNSRPDERYVAFVQDKAAREEVKYFSHLSEDEFTELRDDFAARLAKIKSEITPPKDLALSQETLHFDELERNLKEDIDREKEEYIKELFGTGSQLFSGLSFDIKERFWAQRDLMDLRRIRGAAEIVAYDVLADRIMKEETTSVADYNILVDMQELYAQEIKLLSRNNEYELRFKESAYALTQQLIEARKEIKGMYDAALGQRTTILKELNTRALDEMLLKQAQDIASTSDLPTFEKFQVMPIEDQNTREALENAYVENLGKLLSLPENYKQLVTANTAAALQNLAKDISSLYKLDEDKSMTKYLDRQSNTFTRYAFQVGKDGVAIGAASITNHAVNQQVGLFFNRIGRMVELPKLNFNLNNFEKRDSKGQVISDKYSLARVRATDGSWISETINAFINAFVDVAKDPFIITVNGNLTTAGTYLTGVKLGIPLNDLVYWFNQPAIREYIKLRQQHQYSMNAPKALLARVTGQEWMKPQIIDRVASQLDFETEFGKIVGVPEPDHKFTESNMRPIIKRFVDGGQTLKGLSTKDKIAQAQMLKDFLYLEQIAQELLTYNTAYSWDNKRTTTFDASRIAFSTMQQARKGLFGEFINDVFKNTFIGSIFSSKVLVTQAMKGFFITESPEARAVLDEMIKPVFHAMMSKDDKEFYANDIRKAFITYVLTTTPITFRGRQMSLNSLIHELFLSDKNMATRLKRIQKALQDGKIDENMFIQNAQAVTPTVKKPKSGDRTKVSNITLIKKPVDKTDSDLQTSAIDSLARNAKTADFVQDLLAFAILQSGIGASPISFTEIYPNRELIEIANQVFDKFTSSGATFGKITPEALQGFKASFYKNKWQNPAYVPTDVRKEQWQYEKRWLDIPEDEGDVSLLKQYVGTEGRSTPRSIRKNAKIRKDYYTVRVTAINPKTGKTYTNREIKKMRDLKDYSYLDTDLYEKVRVFNPESGQMEGVVIEEPGKGGVIHFQLLYRPVDKWGDGMYLQEHYSRERASELYPEIQTMSPDDIFEWARRAGLNPRFLESDFMELSMGKYELGSYAEETFEGEVIDQVDASDKAMIELAGNGAVETTYGTKPGAKIEFKRFKPLTFKYQNNTQLVAEGLKTATTRNQEIAGLDIGESGIQKVLGKSVKVTYLGLLNKKEAEEALGMTIEQAEGFEHTTTKGPIEATTKKFLRGKTQKHIYKLEVVEEEPSTEEKPKDPKDALGFKKGPC